MASLPTRAAITPPILDARRFDDLVEELMARIPAHTPEWTNPRQGDPGRAHAIRRTIERDVSPAEDEPAEHKQWVGTLERWLDNLRRTSR